MELGRFCSASRVVIVAGKGGVGKTTVTAALAVAAARTGLSVLIVEVEGKSGLASCFGVPPLGYAESALAAGVRARTLTADDALLEYLETHGMRRFSRRLVQSGVVDVVASAVPGMRDILLLGKVKQLEQGRTADVILVDAPAAGHAVAFLMSPRGLLDAVRVGPVRRQASDVVDMLGDPQRCRVLLVTIPEETPVNELVDTAYALEDRVGIKLGPVVVNACDTDVLAEPALIARDAALAGLELPAVEAGALAAAVAFRHERSVMQRAQAERLAARLPLPQIRLPMLMHEIGRPDVDLLADALERGVLALPESRVSGA
jgi:anion-transporting  ArsA/GET3 family ATPase